MQCFLAELPKNGRLMHYHQVNSAQWLAAAPQRCAICQKFLQNSLSEMGEDYLQDLLERFGLEGIGDERELAEYASFYGEVMPKRACSNMFLD
jgi:hypothetical protein